MSMELKLLLVEDSENDAELVLTEFKRRGYLVASERVYRAPDLARALGSGPWDAVICDYCMPQFNALAAIAQVRDFSEDLPCIVVSGSVGEEKAVETMRAGAQDCILKDNLTRLVPAVVREIKEAVERRRRKEAEKELAVAHRSLGRLKRFFPSSIANLVLAGEMEDPFRWHRGNVTVVFIDLRGFTAFAETAEPEDVMGTLQMYYASLASIAHRHGGSVGHLAGDGVMLFFNDPAPVENPEEKAVLMSIEARAAMSRLLEEWSEREFSLNFGIGIASGYATIGGVGVEGFWDYTVVGTVTNLAARLCSEAKDGQILVSRRFFRAVQDKVEAETVGNISFKGLQQPVAVLNVLRQKT